MRSDTLWEEIYYFVILVQQLTQRGSVPEARGHYYICNGN